MQGVANLGHLCRDCCGFRPFVTDFMKDSMNSFSTIGPFAYFDNSSEKPLDSWRLANAT